ncbi:Uroporphyrinogen-III C-methyltransferase [Escovopsis weberi]|uniref:Uroporphyrinogen-III C-methyltransferase n=1 Tax=Escovopsis weberi TaxID=150374 RepID=A0A0M8N0V2_ESCWE|nr:Uroporphyrinogen-III C-methyltransferase [Escovopsis weberi]
MTASPHSGSNYMLAGLNCAGNVHLILGSNPLAAARCTQSLKAGALPIIVTPETNVLHYSLQAQIDNGSVRWERKRFVDDDLFRLGRREVGGVADAVFVTFDDEPDRAKAISELCKDNRVPVNVVDAPHLCTFSLLSTHTDGPLQIGITTNGRGCKLASRIRREIAASLPPNLGAACAQLGELRKRIQREDLNTGTHNGSSSSNSSNSNGNGNGPGTGDLDDSVDQSALFNSLVTADDTHTRRMRWLSQICEYWPLKRLASVCEADVEQLLRSCKEETAAKRQRPSPETDADADAAAKRRKTSDTPRKQGTVILAGSGPGHPQLLTQATLRAIQTADVVLADKLVPSGVMDLIPRRTMVHIARKFPGNADRAQDELQALALTAAQEGRTVLRLKQGDPFVYGRGGEEVRFFRARGLAARQVVVLPGVTSALSAPLFAGVPPTQRAVADQVLICTGTGRSGSAPDPPEYVPSRTVVFLMALHRIEALVRELTSHTEAEAEAAAATTSETNGQGDQDARPSCRRTLFPASTLCAVVERASCPDQRVIRTTLAHVARAIEAEGSRPPGLLVVGRACGFLHERDETSASAWDVEEGFRGLDDDSLGGDWRGLLGGAPASEGQQVHG